MLTANNVLPPRVAIRECLPLHSTSSLQCVRTGTALRLFWTVCVLWDKTKLRKCRPWNSVQWPPDCECFLVIRLPFLDESWNERNDGRELLRWQKATSCEWIAENLWKGRVEGYVARMGEVRNAYKTKNHFCGFCRWYIIRRMTLAYRLCPSSTVRDTRQCFGNWICFSLRRKAEETLAELRLAEGAVISVCNSAVFIDRK